MVRAGQTVSQVALHMSVAFGVMYALTGSLAFGGIAALIEPVCNVALLPLHDRLWQKVRERYARPKTVGVWPRTAADV
ncbi:MAG TPA: DUF2061 domain-containing protein [Burkholderiales bacterium]|nr:DUF2061 domain-containing protein [Burkholderiales bacterium]